MKTYKQFVTEARELDEGLGTAAKIAMKGINKIAKIICKRFEQIYESSLNFSQ